jgi:hypothetical protein
MKCADYKLAACRDQVFDDLVQIWEDAKKRGTWDEIWQKANTLQAVAQYWHDYDRDSVRAQKAMNLMKDGCEYYRSKKNGTYWVDDFGWWGGFFLDLKFLTHENSLPAPYDQDNLLVEAEYTYSRMLNNLDKEYGGIWNTPNVNDKYAEKNTVTNSWMFRLAAGIASWTSDPQHKKFAEQQYRWLTTGEYEGYKPKNGWRLYNEDGLLLWTPDGDYTRGPNHIPYDVNALWSGNEGVYLSALHAYLLIDSTNKTDILKDCQKLITAAISKATPNGFVDVQNVMHESPLSADWSVDLATGKGVSLRLMTKFARQHNMIDDTFKDFVNTTAQSVWCSRDTVNIDGLPKKIVAHNWNSSEYGPPEENTKHTEELWPLVLQSGGLGALNAAQQLLEASVEESLVPAGKTR